MIYLLPVFLERFIEVHSRSNMMRFYNLINPHKIDIKLKVARILSLYIIIFFLFGEIHFTPQMMTFMLVIACLQSLLPKSSRGGH